MSSSQPNLEAMCETLGQHKDLVCRFFVVFARLEYSLKQSGYSKVDREKIIRVDWYRFANDIADTFDRVQNEETRHAVEYLDRKPPQVLVRDASGNIRWKDTRQGNGESRVQWVLRAVTNVRNNLFHGAKVPFDTNRDPELLRSSMKVIEAILKCCPSVRNHFVG